MVWAVFSKKNLIKINCFLFLILITFINNIKHHFQVLREQVIDSFRYVASSIFNGTCRSSFIQLSWVAFRLNFGFQIRLLRRCCPVLWRLRYRLGRLPMESQNIYYQHKMQNLEANKN